MTIGHVASVLHMMTRKTTVQYHVDLVTLMTDLVIIHQVEQDILTKMAGVVLHTHVMMPSAHLRQIVILMTTEGCVGVPNLIAVLARMIIIIHPTIVP